MDAPAGTLHRIRDASAPTPGPGASRPRLESLKRRASGAAWLYVAAIAVVLGAAPATGGVVDFIATWCAVPLQAVAAVLCLLVLWGRRHAPRATRTVWVLAAAFSVLSLVACYYWNAVRPMGRGPVFDIGDTLYLIDYGILTLAYATLYGRFGGSFRRPRTWLDGGAMLIALLVAFGAFLRGPLLPNDARLLGYAFVLPYMLVLSCQMTMAALLCLQIPRYRSHPVSVLLVLAGLCDAAWEITWVVNWVVDRDFVGQFYNFGDVLCFACIASAAALTPQLPGPQPAPPSPERSAYNFLPALAALLAIALVAGSLATTRALDAWVLVGLVLVTGVLLITRQRSVRRELGALNRELATRQADARIMELVRRSNNLIVVADATGYVTFASPAAAALLGVAPSVLLGMPVRDLLGPAYEPTLDAYFRHLLAEQRTPRELELVVESSRDVPQVLHVQGANELANPHLEGITLTFTDISAQRNLEREVLEVATEERVRIAGDLHDGLGQELTGIAMLLQRAAMSPDPDPARQRAELQRIIGHVNRSIADAKDIARGLSAIEVVRGSLGSALKRLGQDVGPRIDVRVHIDAPFDDRVVDDVPADHLYRIAHEALLNAIRHSGCTMVEVALRERGPDLLLSVTDDGRGFDYGRHDEGGLGLRLMEYRARVIGAQLSVERVAGMGARIEVKVPLHQIAAEVDEGAYANDA